ncbi:MAG: TIGR02757 family protein [Bacteroidetes bacterium]|nr:TIGR02757 family protein [Bacteroidota bacterium]
MIDNKTLKAFLEEKHDQYNRPEFIVDDPISIPHLFSQKEDIEIAGFLTATIAWGNRRSIINNAKELLRKTDFAPFDFVKNGSDADFGKFSDFVHRTFNGNDCIYFWTALQHIYRHHGGLEKAFQTGYEKDYTIKSAIRHFRAIFFSIKHPLHVRKHVADPDKNASAKRLNMFLRWMIRKDKRGVDFGLWNQIPVSALMCPLDVHTGNVSRKLGLLNRNANDWKSVEELTNVLAGFDSKDPVKFDFALFGLGIYEKF